ncbi:DUF1146 family protein [Macrococcus sp. DPC7161]|uniref:DUF1146 family protein n=1 Tax=Macrococcus sp. DPC7161 TaxID=2507060 RepID=UPI00100ACD73|nr:DUF1146 family protein [Macrococcus sp. DPC7161]RXK17551.1 DUF1146 domain-containing protein [Macrococcus sp. DPC7161]
MDAVYALPSLVLYVIMFFVSFYALRAVRLDQWFKKMHTTEIQILLLLMSMVLGYLSSRFIMDIIIFSNQMLQFF